MKVAMVAVLAVMSFLFVGLTSVQATPKRRFDPNSQVYRGLDFYNSGWVSEGAKIFAKSCKNCHYRGNDQGAPFLYSESKTMKGWNRVFAERYPKCAKEGKWAGLSKEDLLKLNDYLYRNAANTYDPNSAADCG